MIQGINPVVNAIDTIIWPFDISRTFTVSSCYANCNQPVEDNALGAVTKLGLSVVWGAHIPSKVKIFGWRLLQNRLATRKQLLRRGIITRHNEAVCVFCLMQEEDLTHIMLNCPKLKSFWRKIHIWLNVDIPVMQDCCCHLLKCINLLRDNMSGCRIGAIWLTICWCIWKVRNDIVFNSAVLDEEELFFAVLWFSWWWLAIESKDRISCNFYEWFKNPTVCI
ncbi:uncharacterized protein LOC131625548 [Vicia villosa]|uniref:uncharacterized protein LOC131625548 n=1 Tax=Vicia villosa TaxID=3911 RepID=UPI00273B9527|nr:uncharacterized protein LOC131625548 [Vicia villosa]